MKPKCQKKENGNCCNDCHVFEIIIIRCCARILYPVTIHIMNTYLIMIYPGKYKQAPGFRLQIYKHLVESQYSVMLHA